MRHPYLYCIAAKPFPVRIVHHKPREICGQPRNACQLRRSGISIIAKTFRSALLGLWKEPRDAKEPDPFPPQFPGRELRRERGLWYRSMINLLNNLG